MQGGTDRAVRHRLSLGPGGQRRDCGGDTGGVRARDLHRCLCFRHGRLGARWSQCVPGAAQSRRPDLKLLFNINAEFADPLDKRPIELRAKSAVFSSLADAVLVSGAITGQEADRSDLRKVRAALPDTPLFANTGVRIDTVEDTLAIADGCIVGTHFKVDGDTWNPVDKDRVRRFMDKVATLR